MFNTFIVNITKKLYNTKSKEMFFRVAEVISIIVILFACAVVGLIYAAVKHLSSTVPICLAVMVLCLGILFFIAYRGKKLPDYMRNTKK